jgi:alpha-glucosidase
MKKTIQIFFILLFTTISFSQKKQNFQLVSPNGKIEINITLSDKITWAITHEKETVLSA